MRITAGKPDGPLRSTECRVAKPPVVQGEKSAIRRIELAWSRAPGMSVGKVGVDSVQHAMVGHSESADNLDPVQRHHPPGREVGTTLLREELRRVPVGSDEVVAGEDCARGWT